MPDRGDDGKKKRGQSSDFEVMDPSRMSEEEWSAALDAWDQTLAGLQKPSAAGGGSTDGPDQPSHGRDQEKAKGPATDESLDGETSLAEESPVPEAQEGVDASLASEPHEGGEDKSVQGDVLDGESGDLDLPDVDETLDDLLRDSQSLGVLLDGQSEQPAASSPASSEGATRIASVEDLLAQAGPIEDIDDYDEEPFSSDEATRIAGPELGAVLAASAADEVESPEEVESEDFYDDIEVETGEEESEIETPSKSAAADSVEENLWEADVAGADEIGALAGMPSEDLEVAVSGLEAVAPGTFELEAEEPSEEELSLDLGAESAFEDEVGPDASSGQKAPAETAGEDVGKEAPEEDESGFEAAPQQPVPETAEVSSALESVGAAAEEEDVGRGETAPEAGTERPEEASPETESGQQEAEIRQAEDGLAGAEPLSALSQESEADALLDGLDGSTSATDDDALDFLGDLVSAPPEDVGESDGLGALVGIGESVEPALAGVVRVGLTIGSGGGGKQELDSAEDRAFEPEPMVDGFELESRRFDIPRLEGELAAEAVSSDWWEELAVVLEQEAALLEDDESVADRELASGLVLEVGLGRFEQALGRYVDSLSRSPQSLEAVWSAVGAAFRAGEWMALGDIYEKCTGMLTGSDAVLLGGLMAEVSLHGGDKDHGLEILQSLGVERAGLVWKLLAEHDVAIFDGEGAQAAESLVQLGAAVSSSHEGGELLFMGGDILRASSQHQQAIEAYDKALQIESEALLRGLAHRGKLWSSAALGRWRDVADELGAIAGMVSDTVAGRLRLHQVEILWWKLHDIEATLEILASLDGAIRDELVEVESDAFVAQGRHDEAAQALQRAAESIEGASRKARLLFLGGRVAESSVGSQALAEDLYRQARVEWPDVAGAELGLWRRLLASEADRSPGRELLEWLLDVEGMRRDVLLSWLAREHRLSGDEESAGRLLRDALAEEATAGLYPLVEAALLGEKDLIVSHDDVGDASGTMASIRRWLAAWVDSSVERFADLSEFEPWASLWPLRMQRPGAGGEDDRGFDAYWALADRLGGDPARWIALHRMVYGGQEQPDPQVLETWPGAMLAALHGAVSDMGLGPGAVWTTLAASGRDDKEDGFASLLEGLWAEFVAGDRQHALDAYERAMGFGLERLHGLERNLLAEGLMDRVASSVRFDDGEPNPRKYAFAALSGQLEAAAQEAKALAEKDETSLWLGEWESLQADLGAWPTLAAEAISKLQKADESGDQEAKKRAYEQLVWVDRDGRGEESSAMLGYASLLQLEQGHQRARRALELYYAADGRFEDLAAVYRGAASDEGSSDRERTAALVILVSLLRRLGRGEQAVEACRQLVSLDPTRVGAQLYLEAWARRKGDLDLLTRSWGALAEVLDDHAVSKAAALSRAGESRLEQGGVEEARAFLAAAVESQPASVVACAAWLRLGMAQERWDDVVEAAEALSHATVVEDVRADAALLAGILCEDELGDDDRAERFYRACLDARATDFDAYIRLSDLLRRRQDYEQLAQLIEERLAIEESPAFKMDLLWEVARVWRDHLGSPTRAIEFLEALLSLKPDHQAALGAVADLYETEGRFEEVADILVRLCRLEKDPEVLQGLLYRLGVVFEEHLGDERKAASVFNQAISVNPKHLEALERLAAIYEHLAEWKAALSISGRILKVVSEPERQVQEYVRLARILEHGYKDMRRAQEALRRAVAAAPEDLTAIGEMAAFYARRGDMSSLLVHLDQAASVMREGLVRDALDVERYRALVRIFKWRRSGGRAARAAEILDLFGLAGPDELALLQEYPSRGVDPARLVDPEVDDVLFGTGVPSSLRQIFRILGYALAKQYAGSLKTYGLSRSTRVSSSSSLGRLASDLASALGVRNFELHRSEAKPDAMVVEPADPAVLVLGAEFTDRLSEDALEFALLRLFKLVQTGLVVPARIGAEETAVLVAAVVRQYVADYDVVGLDPKALVERTKLVGKSITRKARDELMPYAYECSSTHFDFGAVRRSILQGADRAALLGTGPIKPAVEALAAARGATLAGPADSRRNLLRPLEEVHDLLRFAVSDDAFDLAKKLGIGGL